MSKNAQIALVGILLVSLAANGYLLYEYTQFASGKKVAVPATTTTTTTA